MMLMPSPVYPDGFTLEINSGENYEVQGNVITPDNGFVGRLSVRVRVNDGKTIVTGSTFKSMSRRRRMSLQKLLAKYR